VKVGKHSNLVLPEASQTFPWNETTSRACVLLADGYKVSHVAKECGVSVHTIERWREHGEFSSEVEKLSLVTGAAQSSWRMRFIKQAIRQSIKEDGSIKTKRDVLDWLKLAREEQDGSKLFIDRMIESAVSETFERRNLRLSGVDSEIEE
jgi:hypothetical protein